MDVAQVQANGRLVGLLWVTASITTTGLLLNGEVIFPLHLLCSHLVASQLLLGAYRLLERNNQTAWHFQSQSADLRSFDISCLVLTVLTVPILITGYKSIALSNDLPNVILILTLDWCPSSLLEKILEGKVRAKDVLRYLVFFAGFYLICACNFRIRTVPLRECCGFLAFTGLAQIVLRWKIGLRKPCLKLADEENRTRLHQCWIVLALAVLSFLAIKTEYVNRDRPRFSVWTLSTAGASLVITGSLLGLGPMLWLHAPTDDLTTKPIPTKAAILDSLTRLSIACCVSAAAFLLSSRPSVVSLWQYLGYLIAIFAFTTADDLSNCIRWIKTGIKSRRFSSSKDQGSAKTVFGFFSLNGLAWAWILYISITLRPPPMGHTDLALNPSPAPSAQFDIVISRYAEPAAYVARTVESILAVNSVVGLDARVIVYTKNDDTVKFKQDLDIHWVGKNTNISVRPLENVGREGDTYLHHILANWDGLADHTLFAQADMDNEPMALDFLKRFFVPETGFLQLAYEGNVCKNCEHCGSWTDDPEVMTTLWDLANPGKPCRNLVFTFRGQFVVSGPRIRANNKGTYEELLRLLSSADSPMHAKEYTESTWHREQDDSLNHPVFGFTLERFWGIIMHCSELRVGYWSPSQLAAYVRPTWLAGKFPLDYTQCLDRPVEKMR